MYIYIYIYIYMYVYIYILLSQPACLTEVLMNGLYEKEMKDERK